MPRSLRRRVIVVGVAAVLAPLVADLVTGMNDPTTIDNLLAPAPLGAAGTFIVLELVVALALWPVARFSLRQGQLLVRMIDRRAAWRRHMRDRMERERWHALGRLAAAFAHDLNNVFSTINARVEAAGAPSADPAVGSVMVTIAAMARRGSVLTQRMMAYGQDVPLTATIRDLNADLRGALPRLREAAGGADRLAVRLSARPLDARLDHDRLIACVEELVLNARVASPPDRPITLRSRLFVSEDSRKGEQFAAVIEVEDAGDGMAEEVRARATDPFFSTDPRAAGLGLAMVDRFVGQSGGRMEIRTQTGRGTRISLQFPIVLPPLAPPPRASLAARRETRARVLVVDDNDVLRADVAAELRNAGLTVLEAGNAATARAIMAEGIDALVTDVMLAGADDGIGLGGHARILNPTTALVFISGVVSARQPELLTSDDLSTFMRKPVDFDNLIAVLRGLLVARGGPSIARPMGARIPPSS